MHSTQYWSERIENKQRVYTKRNNRKYNGTVKRKKMQEAEIKTKKLNCYRLKNVILQNTETYMRERKKNTEVYRS